MYGKFEKHVLVTKVRGTEMGGWAKNNVEKENCRARVVYYIRSLQLLGKCGGLGPLTWNKEMSD